VTRSYVIIGCGRFGRRAAQELLGKDRKARITAVDREKEAVEGISLLKVKTVPSDALIFLDDFFSDKKPVDYIIPAVPFHLAFEFVLSRLKPLGAKRSKVPPLPGLPNPIRGKNGDLYTSLADFLCPEDCPEPAQYCTVTRKRRDRPLYQILMDLTGPFESKVIRSEQLGLGVGGYRPEALFGLLEDIAKKGGPDRLFLISTACRCHGVTSALSFDPTPEDRTTGRRL